MLGLGDDEIVVNVQGDEPLIDTRLVHAVAQLLGRDTDASMGTAAHVIDNVADFVNPNVVKVVLNYPTRHPCATLASMPTVSAFYAVFHNCHRPPSKSRKHWNNCAPYGMDTVLPSM